MQTPTTFDFSVALDLVKQGKKISRTQFRDTCYIMAQFPDTNSKMTKPYLYMIKKFSTGDTGGLDFFPVDLSCESIFAEDWYEIID